MEIECRIKCQSSLCFSCSLCHKGAHLHLAITGAGGFVGQAVLEALARDISSYPINELTLVSRSGQFRYPSSLALRVSITEQRQDLSQSWSLPTGVTHLLHLAADGSQSPYSYDASRSFVKMTENLIAWSKRQKGLRRVVHTSSGACSGNSALVGRAFQRKEAFIEGRLRAENLLALHVDSSTSLQICRLYTFSGPLMLLRKQYAVSNFVATALRNREIRVRGNPNTVRTYLDQSDLGSWLLRILEVNNPTSSPVLDVGSEVPVKIQELAEFVSGETGAAIVYEPTSEVADVYVPDTTRTRELYRVAENVVWQDSVSRMIRLARTT